MTDDFEAELTRGLRALVDDEQPPAELRARLTEQLGRPTRRSRRWLPAAAAALVLVALLGTALVLSTDDGAGTVDLATDPTVDDRDDVAATPDDETTASDRPAAPAPRTPLPAEAPIAPGPSTTVAPAPAPNPSATAPRRVPPPAPSTTVPPCRNSTDPACGSFRWDPAPENRPATLTVSTPPGPIVAGESVELTLAMSDPDGAVTLDCYSVDLDGPGMSTGACTRVNPDRCPARYGPWTPPAPQPGQASTTTVVQFAEAGTYVVTVQVEPADGCDQVDPYRSGATASITVQVTEPTPSSTAPSSTPSSSTPASSENAASANG